VLILDNEKKKEQKLMNFIKLLPVIFSYLIVAAHYSRGGNPHMTYAMLMFPLILLIRKKWVTYVSTLFLFFTGFVWFETTYKFVQIRQSMGMPYLRLMAILGTVAVMSMVSSLVFKVKSLQERYKNNEETAVISTFSFMLTWILLNVASVKVSFPIILIDRFLYGFGGVEILILSVYAAFISEKLYTNGFTELRRKVWLLFSVVFFTQFLLGLSGFTKFLMTGKLHLPIPALIVGAPIYRGEGFFMIILFSVTVLLAGPAWCSYFCYIGAWDNTLASATKPPKTLNTNPRIIQAIILLLTIVVASVLHYLKVPSITAIVAALVFMSIGIGIMVFYSRKKGIMIHCTTYCPIGIMSAVFGKINPFRVKINENNCTDCMKCTFSCKYHCLTKEDVKKRTPSLGCTLCGDCLDSCPHNALDFYFYSNKRLSAKKVFIVVVAVIHAVFLGIARI
jgi:polyferredoxin